VCSGFMVIVFLWWCPNCQFSALRVNRGGPFAQAGGEVPLDPARNVRYEDVIAFYHNI
jgi:hypothetical protein